MGQNAGVLPNGLPTAISFPPTVLVTDLKAIEQALLFSGIPGKRTWKEYFETFFCEDYRDKKDLDAVVKKCMERLEGEFPFLPLEIVELYHNDERYNSLAACK